MDEPALRQLEGEILDHQLVGPIYGWPEPGQVDFTLAGADLWQQFSARANADIRRQAFAYVDVVHTKEARYFRTLGAARAAADDIHGWNEGHAVTGPTPIGPWQVEWWRTFPEGYRLDVESQFRWQGRIVDPIGGSTHPPPVWRTNPDHLKSILDRHNVTVPEWLLLAAMDEGVGTHPTFLPGWVAGRASDTFGLSVSEEDCRGGLNRCVRNGWLRVADMAHVQAVAAVMTDGPALAVLPKGRTPHLHTLDFTPTGAGLYRKIAAEYLGRGWEDDFQVARTFYREEHLYCATEDGIQAALAMYAMQQEDVRATRLQQIGPWCVRWWETNPTGYRLEVEIGEP
jgi:hypothetical protein